MPDITMCKGKDCPLKDECYRYKSAPSKYRQSYFSETPHKNGNCEYFVKINDEHKLKEKND